MTWFVESFDPHTELLVAEVELDVLAAGAVERLIGARPEVLAPEQVAVVAPLFDIDPDHWQEAMGSSIDIGVPDPDWLTIALVHLVSKIVEERPEELYPASYEIPVGAAQKLVDRFASDVRVTAGDVFLTFFAPSGATPIA